jgi:hypothetical protein
MSDNSKSLTKSQAIEQVASQMSGPLNFDEFTRRVLALWPSSAKRPKAGIRKALQYGYLGKNLLFLDEQTLIPIRLAMRGVRLRVPLTRQEIQGGWLFVYPALQYMAQQNQPVEEYRLEETDGHSIPVNLVTVKIRVKTVFGDRQVEEEAFDLKGWYKKHALRRGDSLLVTVLDWESGRFRLEPEPARTRQKHDAEIQAQNQALADDVFQQLEAAHDERIWGQIAIPTAYARLKDSTTYPADHWLEILEQDPRMSLMGNEIRYADWNSPFESMMRDMRGEPEQPVSAHQKRLSKQESRQVYRFKAALWYQRNLWRRIEIQGGQTLSDWDRILRIAFEHDTTDHMSGFWKLLRRGQSRRFREVDLGSINPFGEGEAADLQIANLAMNTGEAMKFVYDFGDWIMHRVELEAINEPEEGRDYPRISGQNKPRYSYCHFCKAEGRKSVATWICYNCSNDDEDDILLYDTCMEAHDEDHFLEELLY